MFASAAKLVASQVEVSHPAGALQKRPELFNTCLVRFIRMRISVLKTHQFYSPTEAWWTLTGLGRTRARHQVALQGTLWLEGFVLYVAYE